MMKHVPSLIESRNHSIATVALRQLQVVIANEPLRIVAPRPNQKTADVDGEVRAIDVESRVPDAASKTASRSYVSQCVKLAAFRLLTEFSNHQIVDTLLAVVDRVDLTNTSARQFIDEEIKRRNISVRSQ